MALDFPASPSNGQIFSSGGISWTFDGEKWKISSSGIEPVFISSSTPTGVAGQIYWDSDESTAYIYYDDGNTAQWVPLTSTAPVSFDTSAIVSGTLPVARGGTGTTSFDAGKIVEGDTEAEVVDTGSDGHFKVTTEGSERVRVGPAGQIGLGGANYGSSGQVLTSGGTGSAPSWQDVSGGGSYDFVASGAISNGDAVIINTDGTVSVITETQTGSPTAGTPVVYESAATQFHAAAYDSVNGKVVVVYEDDANSDYGTAVIGTVSGDSISFGTPVVFVSRAIQYTNIVYDSTNEKVVIIYQDGNNGFYGTAIVGTVSGTSISFGTATVFVSASASHYGMAYDSSNNRVVISYRDNADSNKGKAIVGTVSGTSITFGAAVTFESSSTTWTSAAYDSVNGKVVIAYRVTQGKAIVGTVSGTSISFGTAVTFSGTDSATYTSTVYDSSNEKIVIAYRNASDLTGEAVVGTVSGTSISFGTPVVFSSTDVAFVTATYDVSRRKVVVAYEDVGNNEFGTAIVGTVSGTSISFGTAVVIETSATRYFGSTYDSANQKVVIVYEDDGSADHGTAVVFSASVLATDLTSENYIGIASEAIADTATGTINIIGGVNEGQTGLTAGQTYYVQGDGSLGLNPAVPSVVAGTAISATKLIVKG